MKTLTKLPHSSHPQLKSQTRRVTNLPYLRLSLSFSYSLRLVTGE